MRSPFRSRHIRVRTYPAVLLALALAACSSNNSTQPSLVSGTNAAGAPASLSISPSSATDSIGHSTQFTATAYDSRGVALSSQKIVWRSSDSTIVRIDRNGRARWWGVGRTTVTASVDTVTASAPTTALGVPIASIVVTPNPANTTVGQTVPFTATLYDSVGNVLADRPVAWLSTAPAVVSVDTTGTGTAKSAGTATISAMSAGILGVASVNVSGTTSNLPGTVVDLAAVASSPTATTLSFTAVGDGTGGNASYDVRFAVHPISWGSAAAVSSGTCSTPVTGTTAGSAINCTVTGLAAATNYDFQVVAYRGTISNNAVFGSLSNVATATTPSAPAASVAQVIVSPSTVSDTVGQHYQFTASVRDSAGNVLTGRAVTWASSATSVVTVNSSGYTSSVGAGSASIRATSGGVTGSATLTVVAIPRVLRQLILTPATATLQAGATQQFSVSGKLSDGSTTSVTATYSATGGTISTGGRYTAGNTAGTYRVIATVTGGTLADTSTVTVTAPLPVLQQLILTPATATVQAGATQQFSVSGKLSDGSTSSVTATYNATGGTITTGGLYTAGNTAGTYRVIATVTGGTLADTSAVTVTIASGSARTYTTNFPNTENPISEGGIWINGKTNGMDWSDVSSASGLAIGHQGSVSYTDATALLTGAWGPDQQVTATVHTVNPKPSCYQEVEMRLRSTISAQVNKGYEISFHLVQDNSAYVIIVKWYGALGSYDYIAFLTGSQYAVKDGDVVSAKVVGNVITVYRNGTQVAQATDNTYTSGAPGMGFNLEGGNAGCAGTNGDYGYTSFTATDGAH